MYLLLKRLFCVVVSLLGIVVTLPIWVLAIIGIEMSDPGPVFYRARRVGKNDQEFVMYKFRSMRVTKNANESNFKADGSRIFPWGAIMRRLKIDELPQLLNCLMGSMTIIGPRPASVDQVAVVRAGKFAEVSQVTPGLSGPSALYDYIYGDSIEDEQEYQLRVLPTRLELDLFYVRNMSVGYDLKMIWWTVVCIVMSLMKKVPDQILDELVSGVCHQMETQEQTKESRV